MNNRGMGQTRSLDVYLTISLMLEVYYSNTFGLEVQRDQLVTLNAENTKLKRKPDI